MYTLIYIFTQNKFVWQDGAPLTYHQWRKDDFTKASTVTYQLMNQSAAGSVID